MRTPIPSKDTISVHAGKRPNSAGVVNAVEPSFAFRYVDEDAQPYPRYFDTPNQQIIIAQICQPEDAPAGLVFASGMAAISTTLLSVLQRGDHVVLQEASYGGAYLLVMKDLEQSVNG